MTLSRIGTGASLITLILTVWLGACGGNGTEACGTGGNMNGTCQSAGDADDTCSGGQVFINTSDSNNTGCPPGYYCCAPPGSVDSGAPPSSGSDSGSPGSGSGSGAHS